MIGVAADNLAWRQLDVELFCADRQAMLIKRAVVFTSVNQHQLLIIQQYKNMLKDSSDFSHKSIL